MRIFRPKLVTLAGEKYEVHIDQTVYVRRGGLRRVKDHELARQVVTELRRLTPPPSRERSAEEVKRAAMEMDDPAMRFRSRVR